MLQGLKKPGVVVAVLLLGAAAVTAVAQQRDRDAEVEPTLEERVTALEGEVARLDTRLETRTIGRDGPSGSFDGAMLAQRIDQLERSFGALRSDLQRIERTADLAMRTASDAQRRAAAAESAARSASRF